MSNVRFVAEPLSASNVEALASLQPRNPFATAAFAESRKQLGYTSYVVGVCTADGQLTHGCSAFIKSGRLNTTVEIVSLPRLDSGSDTLFWDGLRAFCGTQRVTNLEIATYASERGTAVRPVGRDCSVRNRCELVLDLDGDLTAIMSSNHRRNVRKGAKAGIVVVRSRSVESADAHEALINQSMTRRRLRGESIEGSGTSAETRALLAAGAGELFQALREGRTLSSVLVLTAASGAYYQSAGTSPEGMTMGASHFLIHAIATELKAGHLDEFNLGGADENSSLQRFKEGFGTTRVPLAAATCFVGSRWKSFVNRAVSTAAAGRRQLMEARGSTSRVFVYAVDVSTCAFHESADFEFRSLSRDDIQNLRVADLSFRERQLQRLARFGDSYAFGVYVQGALAHVSWLLPPSAMEKDLPRVVRGGPTHAEITCCETLPEFRGRRIYPFAIKKLLNVARDRGFRRVFMKTGAENLASQAGIETAGLERVGSALIIHPPLIGREVIWRRFR